MIKIICKKRANRKSKNGKKTPIPKRVPDHHEGDDYSEYERMRYNDEQRRWQGGGPGGMT